MLDTATQIKWSKTILFQKIPLITIDSNPLSFWWCILTFGTHVTPVTSPYTSLLYFQCFVFSVSFSQPGRYMRTSAGEQTTLVVRDSRVWRTSGIRKWWKFDGIWNSTLCCLFWMVFFVWNLHLIFQHKKHSNISCGNFIFKGKFHDSMYVYFSSGFHMPGYGEPWLCAKISRSGTKRHGCMGVKPGFHLLICTHFTDLKKTRTSVYQLPTNCSHIFMMHTYIYVYIYHVYIIRTYHLALGLFQPSRKRPISSYTKYLHIRHGHLGHLVQLRCCKPFSNQQMGTSSLLWIFLR